MSRAGFGRRCRQTAPYLEPTGGDIPPAAAKVLEREIEREKNRLAKI